MPEFSEYQQTSNLFRNALLTGEAAVVDELVAAWGLIESAIEEDLQIIINLQMKGGVVPISHVIRSAQYETLLQQMDAYIRIYEDTYSPELQALFMQTAQLGNGYAQTLAALFGPEMPGIVASFSSLPIGAIQNIVANSRAGKPLSELLAAMYPLAADGLTEAMIQQVALGVNPRQIAKTATRLGLADSLNHVLLVTRDQSIRAYRDASVQTYVESGVVEGVYRISARLLTTCFMCIELDGKFYTLDEAEFAELHPQDRCSFIPAIKGMPAPQWTSAQSWFAELPAANQKEVLGQGRWDKWQSGIPLEDMFTVKLNATWGPTPVPIPLKDL